MPLETVTVHALVTGAVHDPFSILGLHAEGATWWIRAWVPGAIACTLVPRDGSLATVLKLRDEHGLFEAPLPGRSERFAYDLDVIRFDAHGKPERVPDIYGYWTQVPTFDLDLFRAGRHHHPGGLARARP